MFRAGIAHNLCAVHCLTWSSISTILPPSAFYCTAGGSASETVALLATQQQQQAHVEYALLAPPAPATGQVPLLSLAGHAYLASISLLQGKSVALIA
jgi:hypothetical protein